MRTTPVRVAALMGVAVLCVAVVVAGASAAGSSGPAAAKKLVAQYAKAPTPLTLPVLPRRPAKGLALGFIGCNLPVCGASAAKQAAATLGWKYQRQDFTFTPQSYIQSFDRMLQRPPKALIYQGVFPNAVATKELAQVAKLKIPTVTVTTSEKSLSAALAAPTKACFVCFPQFSLSGRLMAAVVAADGGANPNVVYVRDPVLAVAQAPIQAGFNAALKQFAPGATLAQLNINSSGPAAQVSSAVITYLQKNPKVKYLVFALSSFETGVPQALASAGLKGQVKLVSRAPQAANIANLKSGVEFAEVSEEADEGVWRAFDAAARLSEGVKLDASSPAGLHQIFTKANAGSWTKEERGFPGAFLKAWHINKVAK